MSLTEDAMKLIGSFFSLFSNTVFMMVVLGFVILAVFGIFLWFSLKPDKKVLYFSEDEGYGQELAIARMTPAHVYTKMNKKVAYRFIRWRAAWIFQVGMKTVTRFLAKKGSAFTRNLEGGEAGPFTLYDIMKSVWDEETVDGLKDDIKQKLIESQVPIIVRLEAKLTPEGQTARSELFLKQEANQEMAKVFGENIRREMNAEDWVRTVALIGSGVALGYVAQAIGLIGGVAT
jgi:hypothetical protein